MMDGKPDLRPCPFCGGYARLVRCYNGWVPEHPTYMVVCDKCTAQGLKTKEPEIAVKAWNRRVNPETSHRAPENRVLTLAELEAHYEGRIDAAPLWIEHEHNPKLSCWMVADMPAECFNTISVTQFLRVAKWSYGKRWRCWLRKPTAEEMANTPWEKEA